jgi:hypothetical protein
LYILSMYSSKLGMLLYFHMKIRLFIVMKVNYHTITVMTASPPKKYNVLVQFTQIVY